MATREENLKKINASLELLSDEELDQVAGGTYRQTADDSHYLHKLDPTFAEISETELVFTSKGSYEKSLVKKWAEYGVEAEINSGPVNSNRYKINGEEVSRDHALNYALFKHTLALASKIKH